MAFLNEQGVERLWQHVVAKIAESSGSEIPVVAERPVDLPANSLWFDEDENSGTLKFWNGEEDIIIGDNYSLPVATADKLGGVKSGGDVAVDENGIITINKTGFSINYTATIDTAWTGSAAPYSQEIAVTGITANDTPIIDVIMSGTFATDQTRLADWSRIYRIRTAANKITVYATEKTTASLPIQLQVVR